jgi:RimJ/RimL family protein N-acetyltransferase
VVLDYGFATVGLPEIVAVTATTNLRSQAVIRRIGMTYDPAEDFDDSDAKEGPLRRANAVQEARVHGTARRPVRNRRWSAHPERQRE